jgi:hypothetical protein
MPPTSSVEHANDAAPAAEEQTRQWLLQQLREIMEIAMQ